jgi:hypothetical protein
VPREEREPLREWANLILGLGPAVPEQPAAGNRAVEDFKAYLRELIGWKRAHPAQAQDTDILWALIQSHDAGTGLSELEIIHNSIFMLNAGHDTTASLIANGIDLLLRHPDQCARLAADPTLMRTAIEEMLRAESPLQFGNRRSWSHPGRRAAGRNFLHAAIAAANRDPQCLPIPIVVGRIPTATLPSVTARISAPAMPWLAWKPASPSPNCWRAFRVSCAPARPCAPSARGFG